VPLLSVENVTKRFGALVAVKDVSFQMNLGEILGLIGPNGAGKSTLFNIIAGKYNPDSGRITFEGKRIDGKRAFEVCRLGICRTYQLVKPFLSETVLENVLLGSIFGSADDARDPEAEAEKAISLTGLQEIKTKYVSTLPFIDRRRVELARAIATGAKLVLLDEPMAGLNPVEVGQFTQIIKKIHSSGVSVFIVEHVMHAIMSISTRIIVLDHGEKIAEGSPEEVSKNSKVIQVYLGG
jgi:branched-chain amino acid transport system ATP-binding protein